MIFYRAKEGRSDVLESSQLGQVKALQVKLRSCVLFGIQNQVLAFSGALHRLSSHAFVNLGSWLGEKSRDLLIHVILIFIPGLQPNIPDSGYRGTDSDLITSG